ncbi:hypothetical protein DP49_5883 [Burkholderia pseudomallei]|nr:hypothetical protein DP49_5883 [Burkholderia pseudomallei]
MHDQFLDESTQYMVCLRAQIHIQIGRRLIE